MANIPIRDIPVSGTPAGSSFIVFDDGEMKKSTVSDLADGVRPVASEMEAESGSNNAKTMTPLRVKQSLASQVGVTVQSHSANLDNFSGKVSPSGDVVGTTDAQTLSNKTLTSPVVNSPTGIVKANVGLGNVDNTSDATKNSAAASLTNKDLTSGTNTFPTFNQNTTGSAAKLTTARTIDGQAFDGSANINVVAPGTHAASSKTTPVDADELPLVDSSSSNVLKKLTWANLKATLSVLYATASQGAKADTAVQPGNIGTAAVADIGTSSGDVIALDGAGKLPAVDGSQLINLPGGGGVPAGGTTGQVLAKIDGTDYNTDWIDQSGGETLSVTPEDYGAAHDGVTDDSTAIQNAISAIIAAGGGTLTLKGGAVPYVCNSKVSIDLSAVSGRFVGDMQIKGLGPQGACLSSTTISTALLEYKGSITHDESYFHIENVRISGAGASPVSGSIGLSLIAGAWMSFDRVYIEGFDTGVSATDVDQIGWYNCNVRFNNKGMTINAASAVTSPNSWAFYNTLIAGNNTYGIYGLNVNSFNFFGGSIQGNGRIGGGTGQYGIKLEEAGDGYGTILFSGAAFESNGGISDFVSAQSTNAAQVSFNSVSFLRSVPAIAIITGAANNGSGLIRLAMASTALFATGQVLYVAGVGGVPNATGQWTITKIDSTHIDLQGSTFSGTYTSGGIVTYLGYGTNNIQVTGSNANSTYKISGCAFKSLSPYVASSGRPSISLANTSAKIIDDGSNYFQNSVEKLSPYPPAQEVTLGSRNGEWLQTAPTITITGTAGAFAGSVVMRTMQVGKVVHVQMVITITNIGSATGFKVAYPVTPKQATVIAGSGDSASLYSWRSDSGQVFRSDAVSTPQAQTYNFSGTYESA